MRVLVTGGAGFIGSHLVRALLARGDQVTVLDDLSTGRAENLAGLEQSIDFRRGDVRSADDVREAVARVDAILHQAAQVSVPRSVEEPVLTGDVNVLGTVRLLEAARHSGNVRFVLASSCAVYGDAPPPIREDAQPRPVSPYAASKLAGEHFVAAAAHAGLRALSLRYFNVYGRGQDARSAYAAVVPAFAQALSEGRSPRIFGDGEQERDLCHVSDVVHANLLALEARPEAFGRAFNVGTGRAVTMNELARQIGGVLGRDIAPVHEPERAGDLRRSLADTALAREVLGFEAEIGLEDGLRRTLQGAKPAT